MIINKKKKIELLIVFILCIIGIFISKKKNQSSQNMIVVITFWINGIIWIHLLHKEISKRAYSMTAMHWLFCIFFFCFAPSVQYKYRLLQPHIVPYLLENMKVSCKNYLQ